MSDSNIKLEILKIKDDLFKDVKYYATGVLEPKIVKLLENGGASSAKFIADINITHVICGLHYDENDISQANDIYEKPIVSESWVLASTKLGRLALIKAYDPLPNKLFSNCVFAISQISPADRRTLYAYITFNGGIVEPSFNRKTTHLICGSVKSSAYNKALSISNTKLNIITPDWIEECIKNKILVPPDIYHPRLLVVKTIRNVKQPTGTSTINFNNTKKTVTSFLGSDYDDSLAKTENKLNEKTQILQQINPQSKSVQSAISTSINVQPVSSPATTTTCGQTTITTKTAQQGSQMFRNQQGQPNMIQQQNIFVQQNMQQGQTIRPGQLTTTTITLPSGQQRLVTSLPIIQHGLQQQQTQNQSNALNNANNNNNNSVNKTGIIVLKSTGSSSNITNPNVSDQIVSNNSNNNSTTNNNCNNMNTLENQQNIIQVSQASQIQLQPPQQHHQICGLNTNKNIQQTINIQNNNQQNNLVHQQIVINQQPIILNQNQTLQQQQIIQKPNSQQTQQMIQNQTKQQHIVQNTNPMQINQQTVNLQKMQTPQSGIQQQPQQQVHFITSQQAQQIKHGTMIIQQQQSHQPSQQPQQIISQQIVHNPQQVQTNIGQNIVHIQSSNQNLQQGNKQMLTNQQQQQTIHQFQAVGPKQVIISQQQVGHIQQAGQQLQQQQQQQLVQSANQQQQAQQQSQGQQQPQNIVIISQSTAVGGNGGNQQLISSSQPQQHQQLIQSPQPQQQQQHRLQYLHTLQQQHQQQIQQQQQLNIKLQHKQLQQQLHIQLQQNQQPQSQQQIKIENGQPPLQQHLQSQNVGANNSGQIDQGQPSQLTQQSQTVQPNLTVPSSVQQIIQIQTSPNQQQSQQQSSQLPPAAQQTLPTTTQAQQQQSQVVSNSGAQQTGIAQQSQTIQLPNHIILQPGQVIQQGQIIQQQTVQQPGTGQQQWTPQSPIQQQAGQTQVVSGPQGPQFIRNTRPQWSQTVVPGPQRQLIHLDAQTHAHLQKLDPQSRAEYIAKLQTGKRNMMLRQQVTFQARPGGLPGIAGGHVAGPQHIVIRSQMPAGLTQQQQVQWIQQKGARPVLVRPGGSAPGLSPISQQTVVTGTQQTPNVQFQVDPNVSPQQQQQQLQFQMQRQQQQQYQRLQQLHLQRDQAQKTQQQQANPSQQTQSTDTSRTFHDNSDATTGGVIVVAQQPQMTQHGIQPQAVVQQDPNVASNTQMNSKTKTALANMLSSRLGNNGAGTVTADTTLPVVPGEPSAAGTLRLMTAQHNAALSQNSTPRPPQEIIVLQQQQQQQNQQQQQQQQQNQQQRRTLGNITNNTTVPPAVVGQIPQGQTTVAIPPSPSTIKTSPFSPGRAPLPRPQFYGHNPNLKLPQELFLLGCNFYIVEYDETNKKELIIWKKLIQKHGGEIENSYCPRVTHVLCRSQRHGVVMQAIRDSKRCVTAYWLNDTIIKKQVIPPWQALHLPMPSTFGTQKPATRHIIAISGYQDEERTRLKYMVIEAGARLTGYFSKHNTVLICKRLEGPKYKRAKDWNIPVVNTSWLSDILLGNVSALSQFDTSKYQQFNTNGPFRIDYTLVPHLMTAWKSPINLTQESHERVKRGACDSIQMPKQKKLRTLPPMEQIPEEILCKKLPEFDSEVPHILFSQIDNIEGLTKAVNILGGKVVKDAAKATHLVMTRLARTTNLLLSLCCVTNILSSKWLIDSAKSGQFLPITNDYKLNDKDFEEEFNCNVQNVIQSPLRTKLFNGKIFYMTPSIRPSVKDLTKLILLCGGQVEENRRAAIRIQEINTQVPESYIVLSCSNDLHLLADLARPGKPNRIICTTEFIMKSVMTQKINIEPHIIKYFS